MLFIDWTVNNWSFKQQQQQQKKKKKRERERGRGRENSVESRQSGVIALPYHRSNKELL